MESVEIDEIIVVTGKNGVENVMEVIKSFFSEYDKSVKIVVGGESRQESVSRGLNELSALSEIVLIHDAARIFLTKEHLLFLLAQVSKTDQAVIPALLMTDTVKLVEGDYIKGTLERSSLVRVQTPQCFTTSLILAAYEKLTEEELKSCTDDSSIVEKYGYKVKHVLGDENNFKITYAHDLEKAEKILAGEKGSMRIGNGYDVHRLVEGRELILGGVKIDFELGLLGHSDADVLTHAVMDAILGAAALGDIGTHFPDINEEYKDSRSIDLLKEVKKLIENNYIILNIDVTLVAQMPKIAPYISKMRYNISDALNLEVGKISVKATTTEGLTDIGRGLGMSALATVALETKGV